MAEKIKLLELDLDINQLLKKGGDVHDTIEQLKDDAKAYKKSLKESSTSIKSYSEELAKLEKQGKTNSKEYIDQKSKLESLSKTHETNKQKLQQTNLTLREQKAEYRDINRTVDAYSASANKELKIRKGTDGSIKDLNAKLTHNKNLYRSLSEEQRNNVAIGGKLKETISAQDSKYKELQNSIGTTQVNVGDYDGRLNRLIGTNSSLTQGLKGQINRIPVVGKLFNSTGKSISTFAAGQKSATAATAGASKGLKFFRVALISTGIGAIVIAVVALATAMSKSQAVMDKFKQVTAGVGAVVDVVVDLFVILGEAIFNAISKPGEAWDYFVEKLKAGYNFIKTQVTDRVSASFILMKNAILKSILLIRIAWNDFWGDTEESNQLNKQLNDLEKESKSARDTLTKANQQIVDSFNEISDSLGDVLNEMQKEALKAIELEKRFQDLTKSASLFKAEVSQATREIANKKADAAIAEQNGNIGDAIKLYEEANVQLQDMQEKQIALKENDLANSLDLNLSVEEDAAKFEAFVSQLRDADVDFNNLSESAQISKDLIANIGLSTSTLDDLDEIVGKFTELNTEVASNEDKQRSNTQKLISLQKKRHAEYLKNAKERADKEIKASELSLQKYLLENQTINTTLKDRIDIYKKTLDTEVNILDKQLKTKQINQQEYEVKILESQKKFSEESAKVTAENLQQELDLFVENNQSKIDNEEVLTEDLVQAEQERLNLIYTKKLEVLEQQKQSELISEQDFNLQKLQLTTEFLQSEQDLNNDFTEQQKEIDQINYENQIELDNLRSQNQFEIRLNEIERRKQAEIEAAEKIGSDVSLIEQKYAEQSKLVEKDLANYKYSQRKATLSTLRGLVDQESALGKALAVADITNTTAQSVNKILAQAAVYSSNPATATLAVNAYIQAGLVAATGVAQIGKTTGLFAEGGELTGKSHSEGGIPFTINGEPGFEAEGGEFIVNKRSYRMFKPLVNYINNLGRSGMSAKPMFQNGGELTSSISANASNSNINEKRLAQLIGQEVGIANRKLPNPVTDVKDIVSSVDNYNSVVNEADL